MTLIRLTRITTHVDDAGVMKAVDHHAYGYDALDRIGSHADMTGGAWTYGYNAKGEVGKAVKKLPGGTTEVNGCAYRYHFDGICNRTLVEQSRDSSQSGRSFGYTPDALNQYTSLSHPAFVDVAGSAASASTVTVNAEAVTRQGGYFRKELSEDNSSGPQWIEAAITDGTTTTDGSLTLPAASAAPQYDEDGNLKSDGLWVYTWDAENRLIRCERDAALVNAGAPYLKLEYVYDSQGRRIRTSTFNSSGASTPTSQTLFVFEGWKCVAELDALNGNQIVRKYTWGLDLAGDIGDSSTGNVGALLWLVDTATNKTHVHLYDRNGNVSGLVDATTRKKSATYDYDAFGQVTVCYGDYAKKNPFGFSTKHTEFATTLCYYGYRWYSPMHGRWISRDPIGERGGLNLFGYVLNNPLTELDVLGLQGLAPAPLPIPPTPVLPPNVIPGPGFGGPPVIQPVGPGIVVTGGYATPEALIASRAWMGPAAAGTALGVMSWKLGLESVELERSLANLKAAELQAAELARRIEEERRKRDRDIYLFHYRKSDITGEILWLGSHATTSFFTRASEARMATGADSGCWRCTVGGPAKAFKELAMTPGFATDYEVILPGVVLVYQCTKLEP